MIISLVFISLLFVGLAILISRLSGKNLHKENKTNNLKQFFQYSVLFGLLTITAVGLAGLLGRIFNSATFVLADQSALARYSAFVIVGIPILIGVSSWLRRQHLQNAEEKDSLAWNFYLTLVLVISLIAWASALNQIMRWLFTDEQVSNQSLAIFIVWGAIWLIHLRFALKHSDSKKIQLAFLIGSFIGAVIGIVAVSTLLSTAIRALLITRDVNLIDTNLNSLIHGLIYLGIATLIWITYWIKIASKSTKSTLWFTYLLIVAIGGSLITAVSTLSSSAYQIMVWLIGEPVEKSFNSHFQGLPVLLSVGVSTLVVWWYHNSVLKEISSNERTEVNRAYDYLIALIGLIAAAAGITTIVVSLIESLTLSSLITGGSAINTLLSALTLIAVGAPLWLIHWQRVQVLIKKQDLVEIRSQSRKVYLFVLFGVSGIAAIISAILVVFFIFEDLFTGDMNLDTLRRIRIPLAILISTGLVSFYHWIIFKEERALVSEADTEPEFINVISPPDDELSNWLKQNFRGKFNIWIDADSSFGPFDRGELLNLISSSKSRNIFIVSQQGKPQIINVVKE